MNNFIDQIPPPTAGFRYVILGDVYEVVVSNNTDVILYNKMTGIKEYTPNKFISLLREHEIKPYFDGTYKTELTKAEEIKVERIRLYIEAMRAHPSQNPVANSTVEEISNKLRVTRPDVKPYKPGTLQNLFKEAQSFRFNYTNLVVSKRPIHSRTIVQIETYELMTKALNEVLLNKPDIPLTNVYQHFKALFNKDFSCGTPPTYNTFLNFYNKIYPRSNKVASRGKDFIEKEYDALVGVIAPTLPLRSVECDVKHIYIYLSSQKPKTSGEYSAVNTKLTLYMAIDACTSAILGCYVDKSGNESANGVLNLMSDVIDTKNNPLGGLPTEWVFDNGPGFKSDIVKDFNVQLGSSIRYARKQKGRDKPHIERFFKTLTDKFLLELNGFIPKRNGKEIDLKTISRQPLLTLNEFESELESFIQNYNTRSTNKKTHRGE
ncbi:DDE-type integrase/transposase/recombinase [Paraglaciecola sp. L1A13]|uniref:DDE-type integrase/transposase/recombinase n=1 Tax=Paraglaciecola sp. L1A13 TaxID=2686359 RepID=UPI00131D156D|nr:DDE-type integrase/transposase/recombinase [Paraglaciecola sp. L1A13]